MPTLQGSTSSRVIAACTTALARALGAPVILVVNAAKVTRTAAASVLGCRMMDPELRISGVVLNRIAGERHAAVTREAIEEVCGIPVLGALPRTDGNLLPDRHLGLVGPLECGGIAELERKIVEFAEGRLDLQAILKIAADVPQPEIGRASCRERGEISPTAVILK